MCFDILRRLRNPVRKKSPEKQTTNSWFLIHHNAPAHRSVLFQDFFAKKKMTTLEHPPYSLERAASDITCYLDLNQH